MLISINVNTAVNPPFNNGNSCLKTWLLSASYNTTMLWPSFDLRHNGSLKSSRLSIQASEITSLITVFLFEQHHFMLHLQTKVLPSFLTSSHLLWPISRQNFVLFRMETKKNLQFSFISFFFFLFLLMPLCDTLNLGLCSQHSLPPSGSVRATPPHLSALPPLFAIWFMLSVNVTVLFRKKKITFSFDPLPVLIVLHLISFLLQKSLLSPFFPKYIPLFDSKITTSMPFLEKPFYQCWYLLSTPTAFSTSLSLSMIPEEVGFIFLTFLLLSAHFNQVLML